MNQESRYSKAPITEAILDMGAFQPGGTKALEYLPGVSKTRTDYLTRQKEEPSDELPEQNDLLDELPPVVQFPILRTVKMRFRYVGQHQPLPFPDSDD